MNGRPAGFYCDSGDWPVGPKHGYTPEQVVAALIADHAASQEAAASLSLLGGESA